MDERREVLMTTSDEVPGRAVVKVFGLVRGNSVRARSPGRDIQALGRTIVCGRVGVYMQNFLKKAARMLSTKCWRRPADWAQTRW